MNWKKHVLRLTAMGLVIAFAGRLSYSQTTAVKANDFLNTIGVNTAICYGNNNPSAGDILAKDISLVQQLGIRQIRDDDNQDASCMTMLVSLHQQTGAKVVLVPTGQDQADITNYYIPDNITLANAGALLALEGPNEPVFLAPPVIWQGQQISNTASPFWTPVANYQKALYSAVKANSTLKNYPVWSVTLGGWEANDVGLQYLTIPSNPPDAGTLTMPVGTAYADYANVHAYPYYGMFLNGGGPAENSTCNPGSYWATTPVPNLMWNQSSTSQTLETADCVFGLYLNFGHTVNQKTFNPAYQGYTATQLATLPKVMTETGIGESTSGNPYFNVALTDDQIGRYYLDLYLDNVKNGWSNTYIYELHDGGDGYGLVDNSYNLRTQAKYLQNYTTILADVSSNFTAGSLTYSVVNEPATVHDLLLQKSNGTYYIAVWDEEQAGSGITDTVTVNLGGTYNASEFDPTVGTTAFKTLSGVSSVSLTLSQSPILLELSTTSVPAAPIATAAASLTSTGFSAKWNASTGATNYYIDVSTSGSFSTYVDHNVLLANVTSYAVSGLTANTAYYYRIRATNSSGTSGNSNTITVTTSSTAIPAAPVVAAATSITSTGFTSNWGASTGATGYYLDVSTSSSFSSFVLNNRSVANVTSYAITGLTASTTYYYRVRASNSSGTSGNSNAITVSTSASGSLPGPWVTQDIGSTTYSDSASYTNGVFTITANNGPLQGTTDDFRFVDETASGDWTIIADVTSITDPKDAWGGAGVMIRASTAANAVYGGMFSTAGNGLQFTYRTATGGDTTAVLATVYGTYWVKMTRVGNVLSAYYSTDGTAWTQVGSGVTISAMPTSALAGLAVYSDIAGDLATGTLANITSN